jgi:hypothetical protein
MEGVQCGFFQYPEMQIVQFVANQSQAQMPQTPVTCTWKINSRAALQPIEELSYHTVHFHKKQVVQCTAIESGTQT